MRPCCKVNNNQVILHDLHNRTLLHNAYLLIRISVFALRELLPRLESSSHCPPEYVKPGVAHACTVMHSACLLSNATSPAAPPRIPRLVPR